MKYVLTIDSKDVLLTNEQVENLVAIIDGAEVVKAEYVGNGKGENGSSYIKLLDRPKLMDLLSFKVMSDVEYGALVTLTEVHKQEKNK